MKSNQNQREFYYTDKLYEQYFRSKKTRNEQEKGLLLHERLLEVLEKIYRMNHKSVYDYVPYWGCDIGYADNYGYYLLVDSDRGHFSVINGLPSEDIDSAVFMIIDFILFAYGSDDELSHRQDYKKDFMLRFDKYGFLEYSQCLYYAEYSLKKWGIYYDNKIPTGMINYYESYINDVEKVRSHTLVWKYDCQANEFVLTRIQNNS